MRSAFKRLWYTHTPAYFWSGTIVRQSRLARFLLKAAAAVDGIENFHVVDVKTKDEDVDEGPFAYA